MCGRRLRPEALAKAAARARAPCALLIRDRAMQTLPTVTVFACGDRDLRGFSLKADGSDLPPPVDGSLWVSIGSVPLSLVDLAPFTPDAASVLGNVRDRGFDVAPTGAKILQFPAPHRHSA